MDRNLLRLAKIARRLPTVALRKESVDRNTMRRDFKALGLLSLSARRAWIEIQKFLKSIDKYVVALRKESVDRNDAMQVVIIVMDTVALRKESVDRNPGYIRRCLMSVASLSARRAWIEMQQSIQLFFVLWGRSPQGERG